MEVRIADAATTTALKQDGSLRCLLKIKYRHRDRHSVPAIAWAKRKAEEVSRALLQAADCLTAADGLTICVHLVELGERRHSSWICWDLYLEKCNSEARDRIYQSTRQPIYMISKRGDVLIARRAPQMDLIVTKKYERSKELDSGPQPYFRDGANPPLYDAETGERVEAPWSTEGNYLEEGLSPPNGPDDDGEENKEDDGEDDTEDKGEDNKSYEILSAVEFRLDKAPDENEGSRATQV